MIQLSNVKREHQILASLNTYIYAVLFNASTKF